MFVELIGLPGVGKSTLAAELQQRDPGRVEHVAVSYRPLAKCVRAEPARTLALLRRTAPWVLRAALDTRAPVDLAARLLPLSTLTDLVLQLHELERRARPDRLYVFDELVGQRAVGFLGCLSGAASADELARFLACWSDVHATPIFLELDAATALRRARAREGGLPARLAALPDGALAAVYAKQVALIALLQQRRPGAIVVDAQHDPVTLATEVLERIEAGRP